EKTRNSAQEIVELSESIRGVTHEAVLRMDSTAEVVRMGSALAEKAGASITDINDGALLVLNGVGDINISIQEQSLASREIAASVEKVAQMSETNTEAVKEVATVATSLGKLSGALEASVGSFRI
ncbi:MAG TPA: methyl-accepting chemotaxis protein, partial [Burkholderiales bacterium]|nr:methyl-accepting chemotaxis protein [Burkholderiales bacterium]